MLRFLREQWVGGLGGQGKVRNLALGNLRGDGRWPEPGFVPMLLARGGLRRDPPGPRPRFLFGLWRQGKRRQVGVETTHRSCGWRMRRGRRAALVPAARRGLGNLGESWGATRSACLPRTEWSFVPTRSARRMMGASDEWGPRQKPWFSAWPCL